MSLHKTHAALISGYLALSLDLPTAYEMQEFRPPSAAIWAKVDNVPADRTPVTCGIGGEDEMVGFLQISFHAPQGAEPGELRQLADSVTDYFVAGQRITYLGQTVRITRAVPSQIRQTDSGWRLDVTVYWAARIVRGQIADGPTSIPDGTTTGGDDYEYIQATPAAVWTINHNLGRKVDVAVFTTGGVQVWAHVQNTSNNQSVVTFESPMAGYAIIN